MTQLQSFHYANVSNYLKLISSNKIDLQTIESNRKLNVYRILVIIKHKPLHDKQDKQSGFSEIYDLTSLQFAKFFL